MNQSPQNNQIVGIDQNATHIMNTPYDPIKFGQKPPGLTYTDKSFQNEFIIP